MWSKIDPFIYSFWRAFTTATRFPIPNPLPPTRGRGGPRSHVSFSLMLCTSTFYCTCCINPKPIDDCVLNISLNYRDACFLETHFSGNYVLCIYHMVILLLIFNWNNKMGEKKMKKVLCFYSINGISIENILPHPHLQFWIQSKLIKF